MFNLWFLNCLLQILTPAEPQPTSANSLILEIDTTDTRD